MALDEALRQFELEDPLKAQLVKLRYFAGLSIGRCGRRAGNFARDRQAALGLRPLVAVRQGPKTVNLETGTIFCEPFCRSLRID